MANNLELGSDHQTDNESNIRRMTTIQTTTLELGSYVQDWWLFTTVLNDGTGPALLFRATEAPHDDWAYGDLYLFENECLQLLKKETRAALPGKFEIYDDHKSYFGKEESGYVIRNVKDWSLVRSLETSPDQQWLMIHFHLVRETLLNDVVVKIEVWDSLGEKVLTERTGARNIEDLSEGLSELQCDHGKEWYEWTGDIEKLVAAQRRYDKDRFELAGIYLLDDFIVSHLVNREKSQGTNDDVIQIWGYDKSLYRSLVIPLEKLYNHIGVMMSLGSRNILLVLSDTALGNE